MAEGANKIKALGLELGGEIRGPSGGRVSSAWWLSISLGFHPRAASFAAAFLIDRVVQL